MQGLMFARVPRALHNLPFVKRLGVGLVGRLPLLRERARRSMRVRPVHASARGSVGCEEAASVSVAKLADEIIASGRTVLMLGLPAGEDATSRVVRIAH